MTMYGGTSGVTLRWSIHYKIFGR